MCTTCIHLKFVLQPMVSILIHHGGIHPASNAVLLRDLDCTEEHPGNMLGEANMTQTNGGRTKIGSEKPGNYFVSDQLHREPLSSFPTAHILICLDSNTTLWFLCAIISLLQNGIVLLLYQYVFDPETRKNTSENYQRNNFCQQRHSENIEPYLVMMLDDHNLHCQEPLPLFLLIAHTQWPPDRLLAVSIH